MESLTPVATYDARTIKDAKKNEIPLYRDVAKKEANRQAIKPKTEIIARETSTFSTQEGGNRTASGRLGLYFSILTDQATLRSTQHDPPRDRLGLLDVSGAGNEVDISPGYGGVAIFPDTVAPRATGTTVAVNEPTFEDFVEEDFLEEPGLLLEELTEAELQGGEIDWDNVLNPDYDEDDGGDDEE